MLLVGRQQRPRRCSIPPAMNGIELPNWSIIAASILGAAGIATATFFAWRRARDAESKWVMLYGPVPLAKFQGHSGPIAVSDALTQAFYALTAEGPWETEPLRGVLTGLRVTVAATDSWSAPVCDETGCRQGNVGGQSYVETKAVVVGPSLAALCHECIHVAEFWLDGFVDYGHKGWESRGFRRANDAYTAALNR